MDGTFADATDREQQPDVAEVSRQTEPEDGKDLEKRPPKTRKLMTRAAAQTEYSSRERSTLAVALPGPEDADMSHAPPPHSTTCAAPAAPRECAGEGASDGCEAAEPRAAVKRQIPDLGQQEMPASGLSFAKVGPEPSKSLRVRSNQGQWWLIDRMPTSMVCRRL